MSNRTPKEALREIRNRIVYMYGNIDGTFNPPALKEVCEIADDAISSPITEKSSAVGNAAALREALLRCEAISCLPEIREQQSVRDMRNIIAAALSAPARNCDIYPKRDDAGEAWNKTLDERTRDMVQRDPLTAMDMFIDWLLAYAEPDARGDLCHED